MYMLFYICVCRISIYYMHFMAFLCFIHVIDYVVVVLWHSIPSYFCTRIVVSTLSKNNNNVWTLNAKHILLSIHAKQCKSLCEMVFFLKTFPQNLHSPFLKFQYKTTIFFSMEMCCTYHKVCISLYIFLNLRKSKKHWSTWFYNYSIHIIKNKLKQTSKSNKF